MTGRSTQAFAGRETRISFSLHTCLHTFRRLDQAPSTRDPTPGQRQDLDQRQDLQPKLTFSDKNNPLENLKRPHLQPIYILEPQPTPSDCSSPCQKPKEKVRYCNLQCQFSALLHLNKLMPSLAAPTMVSPSSKKTKKAVEEPPTPLRRSARSAPSKSSITSEIKSPVAPKAKATKKNADKEKPSSSANGIEEKPLEEKSAPRKRAADFYSGDEGEESDGGWDKLHAEEAKASGRKGPAGKKAAAGKKEKLVKKAKVDAVAVGSEKDDAKRTVEQNQERSMPKKSKKAKGPASDDEISLHSDSEPEATDVNGQKSDSEQDEEDEVLDDQTATLLKGFESSDDEDEDEPVDVALAAVKNKEFRNLTIPDVKQKIAARSKKKVPIIPRSL